MEEQARQRDQAQGEPAPKGRDGHRSRPGCMGGRISESQQPLLVRLQTAHGRADITRELLACFRRRRRVGLRGPLIRPPAISFLKAEPLGQQRLEGVELLLLERVIRSQIPELLKTHASFHGRGAIGLRVTTLVRRDVAPSCFHVAHHGARGLDFFQGFVRTHYLIVGINEAEDALILKHADRKEDRQGGAEYDSNLFCD